MGAGLGLAHKLKGDGHCAFALYGDGAANQGQIAEAMNTSALWNVPVIFVCENNHFGMGTPDWRGSKSHAFHTRGDYLPGIRVDGMDVLAMKQAAAWAKKFVVDHGPLCFEADTYRCADTSTHGCVTRECTPQRTTLCGCSAMLKICLQLVIYNVCALKCCTDT